MLSTHVTHLIHLWHFLRRYTTSSPPVTYGLLTPFCDTQHSFFHEFGRLHITVFVQEKIGLYSYDGFNMLCFIFYPTLWLCLYYFNHCDVTSWQWSANGIQPVTTCLPFCGWLLCPPELIKYKSGPWNDLSCAPLDMVISRWLAWLERGFRHRFVEESLLEGLALWAKWSQYTFRRSYMAERADRECPYPIQSTIHKLRLASLGQDLICTLTRDHPGTPCTLP